MIFQFQITSSDQNAQLPPTTVPASTLRDAADDSDWFDEYEHDTGSDHGFVVGLLLLPFDLVMAIVSVCFDVLMLIPFFFRCLDQQRRDVMHAARFYGHHLRVVSNRFVFGPIHFALTDPLGFCLYLFDRCLYAFWAVRWIVQTAWDDVQEQSDDVFRLLQLLWIQCLEVFNLVTPVPSPIHSARPKQNPQVRSIPTDAYLQTRPVSRNRAKPAFVLMEVSSAKQTKPAPTTAPMAHPVFKPSSRTRLAPADARIDPDEVADEEKLRSAHSGAASNPLSGFYAKCPSCASEEVYAVKADGQFARSASDFGLIVQHLFCERCITRFKRPGRLFLAPAPTVRPADTELYD